MKTLLLFLVRKILIRFAKHCLRYAKVDDHFLVSAGKEKAFSSVEDLLRALIEQEAEEYEIQSLMGSVRSSRWNKVRNDFIETHPVCEACGGTKDLQVHHVAPFHLFPELELEESNLMTLCNAPWRRCHFIFGHCNYWAAYNPFVREDAETHRRHVSGRLAA